jgi:hypothetical protein
MFLTCMGTVGFGSRSGQCKTMGLDLGSQKVSDLEHPSSVRICYPLYYHCFSTDLSVLFHLRSLCSLSLLFFSFYFHIYFCVPYSFISENLFFHSCFAPLIGPAVLRSRGSLLGVCGSGRFQRPRNLQVWCGVGTLGWIIEIIRVLVCHVCLYNLGRLFSLLIIIFRVLFYCNKIFCSRLYTGNVRLIARVQASTNGKYGTGTVLYSPVHEHHCSRSFVICRSLLFRYFKH